MAVTKIDYKNIDLMPEEKKEGWRVRNCSGNTYKHGCGKPYRTLDWCTPSGCPHCNATFVD